MIIIGTVLISLCIGFVIPLAVAGNVTGLQVNTEKLKSNAAKQFNEEMKRLVKENFDKRVSAEMQAQIDAGNEQLAASSSEAANKNQAALSAEANKIYADANNIERAKDTILTEMATGKGESGGSDSTAEQKTTSDKDLNEEEILAGYVNTSYLSGLVKDGLTEAEDTEIETYLKVRFSAAEYDRAKGLNDRYSDLVNS